MLKHPLTGQSPTDVRKRRLRSMRAVRASTVWSVTSRFHEQEKRFPAAHTKCPYHKHGNYIIESVHKPLVNSFVTVVNQLVRLSHRCSNSWRRSQLLPAGESLTHASSSTNSTPTPSWNTYIMVLATLILLLPLYLHFLHRIYYSWKIIQ